jgi:predicted transcriptional regulator
VSPARGDDLEKLLGPLEAEVVRAAWAKGQPVTVRQLLDRVNKGRSPQLAYTTVMTVMNRLVEKEVLRRRKQGRGYLYEPLAGDSAGLAVRGVMRDFGDAAMAHFVEEAKSDPEAMRRLQRLLDEES